MTAPAAARRAPVAAWPGRATAIAGVVAALGCGLLAARPAIVTVSPIPVLTLVALFVAVLLLGARLRLPASSERPVWSTAPAVLVGVAAFGLGRVLVGGHAPAAPTGFLIAANTLAAVAEEAWFRRLCFGLLRPAGPAIAVVGSAVLFAAVHVSIYGYWVLPLDLAAGLLLGWQRSSTGSWKAPAITHVVANLLVLL